MRKLLVIIAVMFLWAGSAAAQSTPKAEVFGGYSLVRLDGGTNMPGGWHGSVAGNFNQYLGVVGEFSGHYKSFGAGASTNLHTFTFGPRLTFRSQDKLEAFTHATFGAARIGATALGITASDSAFAFTLGGGVDIKATDRIAIRPVQLDYLVTRFGGSTQNNLRYSAGVVFRFGTR